MCFASKYQRPKICTLSMSICLLYINCHRAAHVGMNEQDLDALLRTEGRVLLVWRRLSGTQLGRWDFAVRPGRLTMAGSLFCSPAALLRGDISSTCLRIRRGASRTHDGRRDILCCVFPSVSRHATARSCCGFIIMSLLGTELFASRSA